MCVSGGARLSRHGGDKSALSQIPTPRVAVLTATVQSNRAGCATARDRGARCSLPVYPQTRSRGCRQLALFTALVVLAMCPCIEMFLYCRNYILTHLLSCRQLALFTTLVILVICLCIEIFYIVCLQFEFHMSRLYYLNFMSHLLSCRQLALFTTLVILAMCPCIEFTSF